MKPAPFEQTPEFKNFTDVMKRLACVPKTELDEQVRKHEQESPKKRAVTRKPKTKT
jgi:hypothetical protein